MKKLIIPVLMTLVAFLAGCNKDEGVCISTTGKIITQDRFVPSYKTVEVNDNINLILTQDPAINRITVEAGENLIDGITAVLDSGKLVLRNENSCNWLRSFEVPVNVYLTFTQLDTIIFQAAGNITCTNDWTNYSVCLDVIEGAGKIDLKLQVYRSFILARYGTTDINLTGNSEVTTLVSYSFGPLHAENLISKFTYVSSYSPNDMFIYSSIDMVVQIGNIGNIYYRGDPSSIIANYSGEGKLIKL
jgi:predicted small secreted protein